MEIRCSEIRKIPRSDGVDLGSKGCAWRYGSSGFEDGSALDLPSGINQLAGSSSDSCLCNEDRASSLVPILEQSQKSGPKSAIAEIIRVVQANLEVFS